MMWNSAKQKNLPATHIETDSYVAVQLIEQQGRLDFDSIKSMAEAVRGNFTFTALDVENSLYIVKGSNGIISRSEFENRDDFRYAS